ncbi:hypothetical protein DH2020_007775 [Rehmannia glutinosa]|uniref:HIG1 domain-containing protein n=1 Tax=Rehmannia glutinosa TaxID=99300 RepID=A0ABR0TZ40_REHGL
MDQMGAVNSELEDLFQEKKRVRNPLVPIGNSHLGQKLMRARVVVQGATVALMVGTAYYYGKNFEDSPWILLPSLTS